MYRILQHPWVYSLAQVLFAPGQDRDITSVLSSLPSAVFSGLTLDVGCGPRSWLWQIGIRPVGLDINLEYIRKFTAVDIHGVVASGGVLPFSTGAFDTACSIGVLHHFPGALAVAALQEMVRVVRPGGYVLVLDNIYPRSALRRPLPYLIRRFDRGRFVRTEDQLKGLLAAHLPTAMEVRRFSYSLYGLEALSFLANVNGSAGPGSSAPP